MQKDIVYLDDNFEKTDIPTKIEIDEQIVDIIIKLNEKGYKTIECCSGHYTEKIYYDFDFKKSESSSEDLKWIKEHLLEIVKEDEKTYYCRGKIRGSNFCVFFDKEIHLPYYPKGFEQRSNSVWKDIEFYHDIETCTNRKSRDEVEAELDAIHYNIRKWVDSLPEYKLGTSQSL